MMNNRLTNDAKAVLQYAQEVAQKFHHDYVGTEHILLGLVLNTDGIAGLLLNQLGLTPENVTRAIEQHVGWGQDSPTKLRLTPRTKRAMELAVREANRLEQNYVGTEHMLAGILEEGSGMAVQILEDMDIDSDLVSQRLSELMNDPAVEGGDAVPSKNGSDLSQFGRDLNEWAKQGKIDPVIGREKEISRVIQILSRRTKNMSRIYAEVGRHAKAVSGGLKTMISPYIHGIKTDQVMAGDKALSVEEHRREWNEILGNVAGAVDILAFQDGQVDYRELYDYLVVNKALADKYGMECWTNIESFDRDMPIRFLPIKWEKLLLKLDAARRAGMRNVITFEFSHFMSPNSAYPQAGHLYDRYCDYFKIDNPYRKR